MKNNLFLVSLALAFLVSCSSSKNSNTDASLQGETSQTSVQEKIDLKNIEQLCHEQETSKALKLASGQYSGYKEDPSYWNLVGACFLNDLRPAKARLFFLRALEENKNYAPSLNNLGVVYWQMGKHYEALSYFKRAEQYASDKNIIAYNLARLYQYYGIHQNSLKNWSELNLQNLSQEDGNSLASNLVMVGKNDDAVIQFKKTKQNDEVHTALYAVAMMRLGQKEEAQSTWRQAKANDHEALKWLWILAGEGR